MPTKFQHEFSPSASAVTIHIANPDDFDSGYRDLTTLWAFQFGAPWATWVLVWEGGGHHVSNVTGLEDALEEAAGWLEENAPGHLTTEQEVWVLTKEVAEEQGVDAEALREKAIDESGPPWAGGASNKLWALQDEATADLMYTESGYVGPDWYVSEVAPDVPLYTAAFVASAASAASEDDFDEDRLEQAEALAAQLGVALPEANPHGQRRRNKSVANTSRRLEVRRK